MQYVMDVRRDLKHAEANTVISLEPNGFGADVAQSCSNSQHERTGSGWCYGSIDPPLKALWVVVCSHGEREKARATDDLRCLGDTCEASVSCNGLSHDIK